MDSESTNNWVKIIKSTWFLLSVICCFSMLALAFYTFIDPYLCESGCGNLTRPIFDFAYRSFGAWGTRVVFLLGALFFYWSAIRAKEK